jgi:tetratricopeptide (TPR) repeat protein
LYDTGNVEFLKNNFETVADFYKEALKLNPIDKDAKCNLELMLLKLNEKNNKQKNDKQKQNKHPQDLKRQIEQNAKAQKEFEKILGRQVSMFLIDEASEVGYRVFSKLTTRMTQSSGARKVGFVTMTPTSVFHCAHRLF